MLHAVSLVALAAVFATATVLPVNMGVLAFVAAFGVGALSGVSLDDVLSFFPGDVFILIAGITLLFGVAKVNGTIDLVISASLRLVRGRRWAIVWLMFALAAILMSLGSVLAAAMLAPVAMPIAARHRINPLLMGMMLMHGMLSTAFSPITVYGAFTTGVVAKAGFDVSPVLLFAVPFGLNLLIAGLLFTVLGRDLFRTEEEEPADTTGSSGGGPLATLAPPMTQTGTKVTPMRVVTLTGMLALLVAGALGVDVGVAAFVIGALLLLASPVAHKGGFDNVNWSAVVLVCGMLSYMAVLKENGTLDMLGDAAASLGSPLFAALLLCFAVGIVSAFGSSIGTLGIALPLAFPLLEMGQLSVAGLVVALAFCSTVVDVSPFSTNGVIILAQSQVADKTRFQRQMLAYCGAVVVLAPLLAWTLAVVPF
ncbi:SLC13 family permease [Amycolatopsis lurida]